MCCSTSLRVPVLRMDDIGRFAVDEEIKRGFFLVSDRLPTILFLFSSRFIDVPASDQLGEIPKNNALCRSAM